MIMKLKRKLLLLTMILTCLCFLATGCNQEEKDTAAPTETKVEEPINEDTADADITKEEAQAFFEEITDSVTITCWKYPLMTFKQGSSLIIGSGSPHRAGSGFGRFHGTLHHSGRDQYIPQRRRPAVLRGIFQKRCPEGLDHIWGTETVTWEEAVGQQEPPMIIETDKYLLVAQGFGGPYDMQFYQIKDVTCDGTAAVVHVYALELGRRQYSCRSLRQSRFQNY